MKICFHAFFYIPVYPPIPFFRRFSYNSPGYWCMTNVGPQLSEVSFLDDVEVILFKIEKPVFETKRSNFEIKTGTYA